MELKSIIRTIPNFPKDGIMFRDVTTVLQDKDALKFSIDSIQKELNDVEFNIIVAPESRGFIFGMPIAYNMNKSFVPIRKKGKLPYETVEESYDLEYGNSALEVHKDAIKPGDKVVIVDDLIATGGTLEAIIKLVEKLGGEVVKICTLIELPDLNARKRLSNYNISSVITFEGE